MDTTNHATPRTTNDNRLRSDVTLHQRGHELTEGREVEQTNLPPRRFNTEIINQNQTPIRQTLRGSTRSRYSPRTKAIDHERQQNVGGRIHNNIPSQRRRRNDPPRGLSPNHHDGTTNTPLKQTQRRETVDNIRKDEKE